MSNVLAFLSTDSAEWFKLTPDIREEIESWLAAMDHIAKAARKGVAQALEAQRLGVSKACVRCNWDLWRKHRGDWRVFKDHRKVPKSDMDPRRLPFLFKEHWRMLCEKHGLSCVTAYEELISDWKAGKPIPGYRFTPPAARGMVHPKGWSYENLMKLAPSKFQLKAMRQGLGKALAAHGPKLFKTRAGLHFFSHIALDDVTVDKFTHVWTGKTGQVCRSSEIGCLEVLCSDRFLWGSVPRLRRDDGTQMGINESHTRLAIAAMFHNYGYSPLGTELILENATATLRDRFIDIIHKHTGGLVTVRKGGFVGIEQAVAGSFLGSGGGNPRHKAWLESFHNLLHNRTDALPGQTGRNVDERPEQLAGLLDYSAGFLEIADQLTPHQRSQLLLPTLEYYSEYGPIRDAIYMAIRKSRSRRLEGWAKCGFVSNQYRMNPELDHWITTEDFLTTLDEGTRSVIRQLVQRDPTHGVYQRPHNLSTFEAFELSRRRQPLVKPPLGLVAELLREDLARPEKVQDCYFTFRDLEIDLEPIRFHSRITTPEGREHELRDRETYDVAVNPLDPRMLWVFDAKQVFMGICPRDERPAVNDHEGIQASLRYRSKRLRDLQSPLRSRHRQMAADARKRDEHNAAVLANKGDVTLNRSADRALHQLADTNPNPRRHNGPSDDTY